MQITVEKTNNGYRKTMVDIINGRKVTRRTNNRTKIDEEILSLSGKEVKFVVVDKSNIKICYKNGITLTLKQYAKNLDDLIFKQILCSIDDQTPIVKNLNINKERLIPLLLSASILITSLIGFVNSERKLDSRFSKSNSIISTTYNPVETTEPTETVVTIPKENQTSEKIDDINFDLETRIMQSRQLFNNVIENNQSIPLSTNMNDYTLRKIINFINSDIGKYTFEVAEDFGVDPYTFISLMMCESSLNHKETIPGGTMYNGYGVGICQLETPNGQEITAFNYRDGEEETIYETMENACDVKTNIRMGIMRYQNSLQHYHGNEKLALQSHNFGCGMVDLIVAVYADELGVSVLDVVNNIEDTGWLKYVKQVSENPHLFVETLDKAKYSDYSLTINYLENWQHNNYGNGDYLKDVYSYYLGLYSSNIVGNNIIQTNLTNNEVIKVALSDVKENNHII